MMPEAVLDPPAAPALSQAQLGFAQIVQIAAFGVDQLAQQALAHHVQRHQLHPVVVAVLHLHALPAGLLGRLHQLPALFQRGCRRHLDRRVLAVAHRLHAHGRMPLPGRGDEDQIEILPGAKAPVVGRAARVTFRPLLPGGGYQGLGSLDLLGRQIADRPDENLLQPQEIPQMAQAAIPRADQTEAHLLEGLRRRGSRPRRPGTGRALPEEFSARQPVGHASILRDARPG